MRIEFREQFSTPLDELYSYFKTPQDWGRLYGMFGAAKELGDGWYAVPLKHFPLPLVAKITANEPGRLVRWTFGRFWKGDGEVRFSQSNGKVTIEGFEEISARWLWIFSPLLEKLFMEKGFKAIWSYGWRRIRKQEGETK